MLLSLVCVAQAEPSMFIRDEFDTDDLGSFNPIQYRGNYTDGDGISYGSKTDIIDGNTTWKSQGASQGDVKFTIVSDGAYKGQALKLSKKAYSGASYRLDTLNVTSASNANPVVVNFKLKILDDGFDGEDTSTRQLTTITAGGATVLYIMESDGPKFVPNNGNGSRIAYELNQWYDVTIKFTSSAIYTTVKDVNGNVATGESTKSSTAGVIIQSDEKNASAIIVDEMYMVQGEGMQTEIISSSLPEDKKNVSRMPEISLGFNQPVFADINTSFIIKDSSNNVVDESSIDVEAIGFDEGIKITVGEMLAKGEDYTMTISGLKNLGEFPRSEDIVIEFTTEFAHELTALNKERTVAGDKTQVDVAFGNTLGYASTPVRVMGIVYENGKMSSLEYKTAAVDAQGNLTVVFDTIAPAQPFSLLVFDESNTLVPVSEAISF